MRSTQYVEESLLSLLKTKPNTQYREFVAANQQLPHWR